MVKILGNELFNECKIPQIFLQNTRKSIRFDEIHWSDMKNFQVFENFVSIYFRVYTKTQTGWTHLLLLRPHTEMRSFVKIFTLNLVILTIIVAWKPKYSQRPIFLSNRIVDLDFLPKKLSDIFQSSKASHRFIKAICTGSIILGLSVPLISNADADTTVAPPVLASEAKKAIDWEGFKLPYNHENVEFKTYLGKATILFNMKIDDPQTVTQFPSLLEIYQKYSDQGLNVLGYPTEQGWFEPDDDETCREKAKVYYGFGSYPHAVIFDKVCAYQ